MKHFFSVAIFLVLAHLSFEERLNSSLLEQYDQMICKNEPSCSLVNHFAIPDDRRSLDTRNCLCDTECVEYRDCCYDSQFFNVEDQIQLQRYYCPPTINVYMKTNCPVSWTDDYTARQCEKSIQPLDSDDIMLILPVTNPNTKVTYGNAFCAYCHNDLEFQPWILIPSCMPNESINELKQESVFQPQPEFQLVPGVNNSGISIFITGPFLTPYMVPRPLVQPVIDIYLYPQFLTSANGNFIPTSPVTVSTSNIQNSIPQHLVRRIRQTALNQYKTYKNLLDSNEIWKYAKFDKQSKRFISNYNGMNFICEIGPKLPESLRTTVRTCVPNIIETCIPGTDPVQLHYCRESTSIVYNKHTKKAYRNKFCAFCNLELQVYLTGCLQKTDDELLKSFEPSFRGLYGGIDPCSQFEAFKVLNCPKK